MRRSLAVVVASLVAATALGAVVVLQHPASEAEASPEGADHVTLYENGLAFVRSDVAFDAAGGPARLAFDVPGTVRPETFQVAGEGVVVEEIRATGLGAGDLRPGDRVVVHVVDGPSLEGTFLGETQGRLLLATEDGTASVERGRVAAVEVLGDGAGNATAPVEARVEVVVRAPPGPRDLEVSYLMDGAGWTPSYLFDAATGALEFYATVTAPVAWEGVTLDLVAGEPHLPGGPGPFPALEAADAATRDAFRPSAPLGSLHVFRLEGPVDLPQGEGVRLLVEAGRLDVLRRFHDVEAFAGPVVGPFADDRAQDVPVLERVTVRNALGEPLPSGTLHAYRNGTWIGADALPALPSGDVANLTLAVATDVDARLVAESASEENVTWALVVRNLKDEAIDLRASVAFPVDETRVTDVDPAPALRRADEVVWDAAVPANATATFRVTLASERPLPVEPPPLRPVEGAPGRLS